MKLGLKSFVHHGRAIERGKGFSQAARTAPGAWGTIAASLLGDALGNDEAGDCVEAGLLRQLQAWDIAAAGSTWVPDREGALGLYSAISGYRAGEPSTDNGTDLAAAEQYVAETGLTDTEGFRSAECAEIHPERLDLIDSAIRWCGGAGLCWNLPQGALDDTSAWDVVDGGSSPIVGGHYTTALAFDRANDAARYTVLSWGLAIPVSRAFVRKYLVTALAWYGPEI